ncbi:CU044_5270 family protein [Phytomonospora sp. NPDC050363]|uniref:CU044_5270 family protein n=1 Tax=Phytomonospora sp. NPDC050363 TaxID=3155642 RepID=UPI0033F63F49
MTREHDDRDELARLLPDPADRGLSTHRHRQIQEFLMTEMQPPQRPVRRPRRGFALVTASVLAAAAVAAGAATGGFGLLSGEPGAGADVVATQQPSAETPVAATFRLAAAHAATQEWTDPRPDQWTYTKYWSQEPGPLAEHYRWSGPPVTREWWEKIDGTKVAGPQETERVEELVLDNRLPFLMALPTDPQELLAALREELADPNRMRLDHAMPFSFEPKTEEEWNLALYSNISSILQIGVLPPDVTSALWQAAALIPGVVQRDEIIEIEGRKAVAVSVVLDGWFEVQLLLDPDTHEYVGRRTLYAADHTYGPDQGNVRAKKGEVEYVTIRLDSGIVDKAGDTT